MTAAPTTRPRVLIAYYSRTGNTRRVAEALAAQLGADLEPIVDRVNRLGFFAFLRAARDAIQGRLTDIAPPRLDPAGYDLLVVGTPVWGSSLAPAVRTWLSARTGRLPDTALFLTHGGSGRERVFAQMTGLCGRFPVGALALREQELREGSWEGKVRGFAAELAALAAGPTAAGKSR